MTGSESKSPEPREQSVEQKCGEVNSDSVMRELGQAGRFHLRMYVLVALVAVQVGMLHTTYIFLAGSIPYSYGMESVRCCNSLAIVKGHS
ncbi:unnamed protein product, partial [Brenthis ino]